MTDITCNGLPLLPGSSATWSRNIPRKAQESREKSVNTDWIYRESAPLDAKRVRWAERAPLRLYFIREGEAGPIKIGVGAHPEARMSTLQVSATAKLTLLGSIPGSRRIEREWHTRFGAHHVRGEWFHPVPELMAAIEQALARP